MEKLAEKSTFETSNKAPRRPRGLFLRLLRFLFNLSLISIVVSLSAVSGMYGYVVYVHAEELGRTYPDLVENSFVYDADGGQIGEIKARENRRTVGEEELGELLPQAVVAVEDRRFYEHWGVDFAGISRAAWEDIRELDVNQGGSTITEQLVKNLYIEEERRGKASPWRRFEQAALSFAYERRHTKDEVLTSYLNTVYFGDGAYGAEEAARRYFGKSASELDLPEAAALAGFLHAPSTYLAAEGEGSERAVERRNEVLENMAGQGMISIQELIEAKDAPIEFAPDEPPLVEPVNEPFMGAVRRDAEKQLGAEALARGGLEIYTTLEAGDQQAAVEAIESTLDESGDPSGAVASVEPGNGAIRALAGQKEDFNLALDARRQPGSSFKPFVLATALKEFVSPETTYLSRRLNVEYEGQSVEVGNYDDVERGRISLDKAMAESDNTVYLQLGLDMGPGNVAETAQSMGITSPVDPFPSTAIGGLGTGVSALEMASAYATFAAGGVYREPYAIERVDKVSFGESASFYDHRVEGRRALTENQAALATEILRGVVQGGTARLYHDLDSEIGRPSAGKTGTSEEFADAWYAGFTPQLSTAVWVGYPEERKPMLDIHDLDAVNGENLPLDLWSSYMAEATAEDPVEAFPRPDRREFAPLTRGYAADPAEPPPSSPASTEAPTPSGSSSDDVRRRYGYETSGERTAGEPR